MIIEERKEINLTTYLEDINNAGKIILIMRKDKKYMLLKVGTEKQDWIDLAKEFDVLKQKRTKDIDYDLRIVQKKVRIIYSFVNGE